MNLGRSNTRILLVEDEAIVALDEARVLKAHGFDVVRAPSGEVAIEQAVNDSSIDLILMDIDLGTAMDGTEAAAAILAVREVPIIFLTNHSEREIVEKVKGITRYGYVLKSSGEFVLIEAITMGLELFVSHRTAEGGAVDYRFLEVNPAFERVTGLSADELPGKTVRAVRDPACDRVARRAASSAIDKHGEFDGAVAALLDVTDARKVDEQAG